MNCITNRMHRPPGDAVALDRKEMTKLISRYLMTGQRI
jgi:hypothetical protein